MRGVTPSEVVSTIDRAFKDIDLSYHGLALSLDYAPTIGPILSLVDRVPESNLWVLSQEDQVLLHLAVEQCRSILPRWNSVSETEYKMSGGPKLKRTPMLGGRHPVEVIRQFLARCPDAVSAATSTPFPYLGSPALAATLEQDMNTAISAFGNGEYKAAAVMAGAVLEALLLWAVKRPTVAGNYKPALAAWQARPLPPGAKKPPASLPPNPDGWVLYQLIAIGRELPVMRDGTSAAVLLAKDFRNLIHPGRASRAKSSATRGGARQAIAAAELLLEDLEARVKAGTL